jgi:hypothetical protein
LKHFAAPSFWNCYQTLPKSVRELADKNYELLKLTLHTRLCISRRLESTALSELVYSTEHWLSKQADDLLWFWIGPHSEYDKLIG